MPAKLQPLCKGRCNPAKATHNIHHNLAFGLIFLNIITYNHLLSHCRNQWATFSVLMIDSCDLGHSSSLTYCSTSPLLRKLLVHWQDVGSCWFVLLSFRATLPNVGFFPKKRGLLHSLRKAEYCSSSDIHKHPPGSRFFQWLRCCGRW